jgi:1,2-diacylglycerol 3-beta-galactosyltransferase
MPRPTPLLFLISDTGGGHRSAAEAVADALALAWPGRFRPVLLDPLSGPGSAWLLRRAARLYGPVIRRAPWAWGAAYRASNSAWAMGLLERTVLRLAERPVLEAAAALRPAALVSFHPLATPAAVAAASAGPVTRLPVVTVVTDLVSAHAAWRYGPVDEIVTPSARMAGQFRRQAGLTGSGAGHCIELGLPVGPQFRGGPLPGPARARLRQALGVSARGFLVVVTGGGEGAGKLEDQVPALLGAFADIEVVAICGRNDRLRRRLTRLVPSACGRLSVHGFVTDMADWLRCADVVVTKAGPGTIAEAACCGAALIVGSSLPGQEDGNAEFVVAAGAGRPAPGPAGLVREITRLRRAPAELAAMRAASARLGRPGAAASIAALIASRAGAAAPAEPGRFYAHA